MPRKARIDAPGALHQMIVRGIGRLQIFSSELGMDHEQIRMAGKHSITVTAQSLLCYWAVRKLGFSTTEISKKLGVSQPSVSISVKRGEKTSKTEQLELIKD